MTDTPKSVEDLARRLDDLAEWFEMCGDIHKPRSAAAVLIRQQAAELAKVREELACTIEELIDHNGDDMADSRAARVKELRTGCGMDSMREIVADAYKWRSGKRSHASDCATSNAPALQPGPCDCFADDLETECERTAHNGEVAMMWHQRYVDANEARIGAERERDAAVALVERMQGILPHVSTESGVCCCGDDMERHADPMSAGHNPVDSGGYAVTQWEDATRAFLATLPKGAEHVG